MKKKKNSLLQHHSSKASILQCSAFFIVQLSYPYKAAGKTIALTRQTFVGQVMSQLFNKLSRLIMEKSMATHSSTLAWKIPWMEEPGRLQSMGSWRVTTEQLHFHFHALEKEMATHSSVLAENPRDSGDWWAVIYGVAQSWTRLRRLNSSSSRLIITFLPRSKCLLLSWLQSPSAVILEPPKIKSVTVFTVSPSICHEVMGPDAMILVFWMLSLKPTFSLSSFY